MGIFKQFVLSSNTPHVPPAATLDFCNSTATLAALPVTALPAEYSLFYQNARTLAKAFSCSLNKPSASGLIPPLAHAIKDHTS